MRNRLIVSKTSIIAVILFLTQFVTLPYFAWYNVLKHMSIIIVGGYIITKYKCVIRRKYALINVLAFVFGGMLLWTSFQNRNQITSRNPFLAAIVFVELLLAFLFFMEITIEEKKVPQILNIFYRMNLIVLLVNDILILAFPDLYLSFGENYFIGTKFEVVYLHFLLVCLYIIKSKDTAHKNFTVLGMLLWTFFIGVQVKCSTGLVGTAIMIILIIAINKKEDLFLNPVFYVAVQAVCFGFVFFCDAVLNNPTVENFVVNILGKNATMSGRANIYIKVPMILTGHRAWTTGFGYATSYELGRKLGGFPDTQNGILEWIWYAGVPTTIIMLVLFMVILYISKQTMARSSEKVRYMLALLYLLTILGMVEITITQMYFAIIICIMGIGVSCSNEPEENLIHNAEFLKE